MFQLVSAWLLGMFLAAPSPVSGVDASVAGRQPVLATDGRMVGMVVGRADGVYFAGSIDGGQTFATPVKVSGSGHLALGMRRGPRLAMVSGAIVITAIVGERGKGADGDLLAWRSTDGGRTWSTSDRVNDVVGSAREGLHNLTSDGKTTLALAWLDLRATGTRIYASVSRDAGRTWSADRLVYESPSGSICQCCHPSVAIGPRGDIAVMFRNQVQGTAKTGTNGNSLPARDMYLARSADGQRFAPATKLGEGTWPLAACPMDGGDVEFGPDGVPLTIWRRAEDIYMAGPESPERRLASGLDPVLAVSGRQVFTGWTGEDGLLVLDGQQRQLAAIAGARWPALLPLSGQLLLAWERDGSTFVRSIGTSR